MVGTKTEREGVTGSSYLRKIRKPMVEKQRRERMNHSISQLKLLIAQTIKQNTAPMTRIDKADILDLTVYHLQQMQQQQRSATMATEVAGYSAGFKDCAREVGRYFSASGAACNTTVEHLNSHLHNTYNMTSRQRFHGNTSHLPQGTASRSRMVRLSTPIRQDYTSSSLSDISQLNYSPIQDGAQTSLSSLSSDMGQSSGYSSSDSSFQDSGLSVSSYSEHDSGNYMSSSPSLNIQVKQEIVTIGTGKENEIGHVISDSLWRPW